MLLEELFIGEGILFDPQSTEDLESAFEDLISLSVSSMQETIEELNDALEKVTCPSTAHNESLRHFVEFSLTAVHGHSSL